MESPEMIVSVDCYHLLMKQQVLVKVTVFDLIDQVPFLGVEKRYLKMTINHEALEYASFQLLTKSRNQVQYALNVVFETVVFVYLEKKDPNLPMTISTFSYTKTLRVCKGMTLRQMPCYIFGIQMVLCSNAFEYVLSSLICLRMSFHRYGRKRVFLLL